MKAPALALSCLALACSGLAAPALAGEAPITREGLLAIAGSEQAWCSEWRPSDGSCADIGFMEPLPDGRIRQTYRFRLTSDPDLEVLMQETVSLEGGEICSVFRFDAIDVVVLQDGRPAPMEQSLAISLLLQSSMSEYEGKKTCERYTRDDVTGEVSATVTLDGERAPTLDSTYRLIPLDTRIHLRPVDEGPEPTALVT